MVHTVYSSMRNQLLCHHQMKVIRRQLKGMVARQTLTPTWCSRRYAFETPDETAARLAGTGLKKSALRQIPVAVYGSSVLNIPATECPICLGEFADGEKVRVLPRCNHGFHVRCIDTWLGSHSSCPTCRQSLLEQPTSSHDAGDADAADVGIRHSSNASEGQGDVAIAVDEVG
ncbi:hypothetical protein ACB098_06G130400 [Castanea mollissima]